jgi:hypothetical protein
MEVAASSPTGGSGSDAGGGLVSRGRGGSRRKRRGGGLGAWGGGLPAHRPSDQKARAATAWSGGAAPGVVDWWRAVLTPCRPAVDWEERSNIWER